MNALMNAGYWRDQSQTKDHINIESQPYGQVV